MDLLLSTFCRSRIWIVKNNGNQTKQGWMRIGIFQYTLCTLSKRFLQFVLIFAFLLNKVLALKISKIQANMLWTTLTFRSVTPQAAAVEFLTILVQDILEIFWTVWGFIFLFLLALCSGEIFVSSSLNFLTSVSLLLTTLLPSRLTCVLVFIKILH